MTKLIEIRKPTRKEKKEHGGEIVFIRKDKLNKKHKIYADICYESWQQWGTNKEILGDNVSSVEAWRRGLDIN